MLRRLLPVIIIIPIWQKSYNGGLMDKFVESSGIIKDNCSPNQVMAYFDGNTVTAFWNYAQHFAMSDNFYSTIIGPSLPGHINLVSGQSDTWCHIRKYRRDL
jgi:phospholipase C